TGRPLAPALRGHTCLVTGAAFSPDGKTLATASKGFDVEGLYRQGAQSLPTPKGEVILWDVATRKRLRRLGGYSSVSFSPDGRRLAAAGLDRTVKVWEVDSPKKADAMRGHTGRVVWVAFCPDGRLLASLGKERDGD